MRLEQAQVGVRELSKLDNGNPELSDWDTYQLNRFRRFLRYEMDAHEARAYEDGQPMSSANDPDSYGMGT